MPEYLSPGVYVEEVPQSTHSISAVSSSTAGIVGLAPRRDVRVNEAVAVTSWSQFRSIYVGEGDKSTPLAQAVLGFFLNGGARCYIVNTGSDDVVSGNGKGLDVLEPIDDASIILLPGKTDAKSHDALLTHAESTADRFAILDSPLEMADLNRMTQVGKATVTGEAPAGGKKDGARARISEYGAQYAFGVVVADALDPSRIIKAHPSGYVAGIYARTDFIRGVHKAPANEVVRGALDVTQPITERHQGVLNPGGINAVRFFSREGVKVYGARTLAPAASEYRYVPVRRLLTLIRLSIERGTGWVVFEPNDQFLWAKIRRDIRAFLTILWRQGALMGTTPEEAFFVKCDRETNPPESIDEGRVITEIGVAPVKPAEFVIFRIGQTPSGVLAAA